MWLKFSIPVFAVAGGLILAISLVTVAYLTVECNKMQQSMDTLFHDNEMAARKIFMEESIPCVICTEQGQVISANAQFQAIYSEMYLNKLFTAEELEYTAHTFEKKVGEKYYDVRMLPMDRTNGYSRNVLFIRMVDITERMEFAAKYEATKPVVAKIYVDNYDNMSTENDMYSNSVLNKIEERIIHLTKEVVFGIYRREIRSFLIVFEAALLPAFEENAAKFLRDIHDIKTEDGKYVSLSIGVGCESTVNAAAELAGEAIEMALGRGGDQAVVRRSASASPKYYGDGNNSPEQTNSRVHVRTMANNLRECILDAEEVYIMGHRDEDVDCIGSAMGLMGYIINKLDKRAYFVCGGGYERLVQNINTELPEYLRGFVVSPEEILPVPKQDALLIIVDTQREVMLSSKELYYQLSDKTIVIDHHRRSEDALKNTLMSFMESAVSSVSEMVTEMLQSLSEQKKPIARFEATALFAGIAMDTKGFVFNTGRRTFEAAAVLKKCGADTTAAMMMYQDDKPRYEAIAALVTGAQVYRNGIAISVCEEKIDDPRPVIARAADALVSLKGISASIVLVKVDSNVIISARSTGETNVQLICEALGGGGHRTVAGAQLKDSDCETALALVKEAINSYFGEKESNGNESDTVE
ncbi:MAG: DHH family phosphoesterase [Clostridia bacterium]|nr:DHH family phosphoesterase [Clostridia bacterium]